MARIPEATRDTVPNEFVEAFDDVLNSSNGRISGPTSITINSPEMAKRRGTLTNYLRYETQFARKYLELAIITTARLMDCPYVWNAHAPAARKEGISESVIQSLRDKKTLPDMEPAESVIIKYATEFYTTHQVTQGTFDTAIAIFGVQYLVEITSLMGHYAQTAFILNAFDVQISNDSTEPRLSV
jgi:4-carboxymuconolactone decarboxylase